jgi:hypothetical protein
MESDMSPLDELTRNLARSGAIISVVQELMENGEPSYQAAATACNKFGNTFDGLGRDEYDAAVALLRPAEFEADEQPAESVPSANDGAPEMSRDQATKHLQSLKDALHVARQARMAADDAVQAARADMATAIGEWNGSGGGYTREMLMRDNIAANQQHRIDVAEGRVRPATRNERALRSAIDREAFYNGQGDANVMVRSRHQYGSFHRAALGPDGQMHRPGRRGATVAKVPSER